MKPESEYSKLLRDPRWQKKRLEILNRDGFCCQACFNDKETLHVHHKRYIHGFKPWEYKNETLITLCETCHESESQIKNEMVSLLLEQVEEKFLPSDIQMLACGFNYMGVFKTSEVTATAFSFFFQNGGSELMEKFYFENISKGSRHAKFKHKNEKK